MATIGKRAAMRCGKTLNDLATHCMKMATNGAMSQQAAERTQEAVRVANEIIYQYYIIPRDVREYWHQEVGADGVPLHVREEG